MQVAAISSGGSAFDHSRKRQHVMDQDQDDTTTQIWASAVHAVTVQKRSLRYAAERYGVDCQALKRRVSTSYASKANSSLKVPDTFRLTGEQEKGVLTQLVNCGRYLTMGEVPPNAVRDAVLAVAGNGDVHIPMGFPSNRWIASFKRSRSFPEFGTRQYNAADRKAANTSPPAYQLRQSYNPQSPVHVQPQEKFALDNRNQQLTSHASNNGVFMSSFRLTALDVYLSLEDETGVLRVVRAHADVGVFMEYQDLVCLLHRTAKKSRSWLTPELLDSLVNSFVSRTHVFIGHLVNNWPDRSRSMATSDV